MANPEDLGRYRLKRLLGRGVLGEVWEAVDQEQEGNRVVVKIMHAADDELAMARNDFARDARLMGSVRHPNVVVVQDGGEAAGTSFLVMDRVEGKSLRSMIDAGDSTPAQRLIWLAEIASGLAAIHEVGMAHRDLKPENVIIRPDQSACIVDLGIAKWRKFDLGGVRVDSDLDLEAPETPAPKTDYAPPEAIAHQLFDELGDQYAWGVLGYELCTGALPTDASPPLTDDASIAPDFAKAIDRARSGEREERFPDVATMLAGLTVPESTPPPSGGSDPPKAEGEPAAVPSEKPRSLPRRSGTSEARETKARMSPLLIGVLIVGAVVVIAVAEAFC